MTAMEVFILALLSTGRVSSIYEFKSRLPQGAMQSTLSRLESLGCISRGSPVGSQQRKKLAITKKGREALHEKWTWGLGEAVSATPRQFFAWRGRGLS